MTTNIEITIYLNNIKKMVDTNKKAAEYFFRSIHSEKFFELVLIVAQKNHEDKGDPALTMEQFESIREKILFNPESSKDITAEIIKNLSLN